MKEYLNRHHRPVPERQITDSTGPRLISAACGEAQPHAGETRKLGPSQTYTPSMAAPVPARGGPGAPVLAKSRAL